MNLFTLQKVKPSQVKEEVNKAICDQNITKDARANAVVVAGDTLATIQ